MRELTHCKCNRFRQWHLGSRRIRHNVPTNQGRCRRRNGNGDRKNILLDEGDDQVCVSVLGKRVSIKANQTKLQAGLEMVLPTWTIAFVAVIAAVEFTVTTKRLVQTKVAIGALEPCAQVAAFEVHNHESPKVISHLILRHLVMMNHSSFQDAEYKPKKKFL